MKSKIILYPLLSLFFALILWFLDGDLIRTYFSLPFLAGFDGSGHWSIGQYYSTHIFPKTWGWIPVWSGGMPFPQYYPPFFFFFSALVAHLVPWVEYLTITKLLVIGSAFLIPMVIFWVSRKIFSYNSTYPQTYITPILSGLLSILIITTTGGQSSLGFTLESAINNGFVPQFFALIPILLCLGFVTQIHHKKSARYGAGIFFLIAILTNVHTALFLVIAILIIAVADILFNTTKTNRGTLCFRYFKVFATASLLSSIWFFPLVATYSYFSSAPLPFDWDRIDLSLKILFCFSFPIAGIISIRRKNAVVLGLAIALSSIALLSIFRVDIRFPNLPFHMYRWLAITPYVSMIFIGYIADSINFRSTFGRVLFSFFLLFSGIYIYKDSIWENTDRGIYKNYHKDRVEELISYIQKNPGMTAVGAEKDLSTNASFIIDAKLGLLGIPTITHIIRESAPSGLFLTPIRNTFSESFEMAGVRTYIGKTESFTKQPIEDRVQRALGIGLRYIITTDPEVIGALSTSTRATAVTKIGPRYLFELHDYRQKVSLLENLPTLVFTNLNFKARQPEEMSFTMINEQALLQNVYPSIILARDPDRDIDEIPYSELHMFGSLVFVQYKYKNIDMATTILKEFSKHKNIYAVENSSPLFTVLKELSITNKNIHIYPAPHDSKKSQTIISSMFDIIKKEQVSATNTHPYYIRQTYFPWWKRKDGQSVYAASPFYTLIFTDSLKSQKDIENLLEFTTGKSVYFGGLVTVLTLLIIVYSELYRKRI